LPRKLLTRRENSVSHSGTVLTLGGCPNWTTVSLCRGMPKQNQSVTARMNAPVQLGQAVLPAAFRLCAMKRAILPVLWRDPQEARDALAALEIGLGHQPQSI